MREENEEDNSMHVVATKMVPFGVNDTRSRDLDVRERSTSNNKSPWVFPCFTPRTNDNDENMVKGRSAQ
jgi:hypothetical protein